MNSATQSPAMPNPTHRHGTEVWRDVEVLQWLQSTARQFGRNIAFPSDNEENARRFAAHQSWRPRCEGGTPLNKIAGSSNPSIFCGNIPETLFKKLPVREPALPRQIHTITPRIYRNPDSTFF
jgi:hypothetical protein